MQMNANLYCSDGEKDYLQRWRTFLKGYLDILPQYNFSKLVWPENLCPSPNTPPPSSPAPVNKFPDMARGNEGWRWNYSCLQLTLKQRALYESSWCNQINTSVLEVEEGRKGMGIWEAQPALRGFKEKGRSEAKVYRLSLGWQGNRFALRVFRKGESKQANRILPPIDPCQISDLKRW